MLKLALLGLLLVPCIAVAQTEGLPLEMPETRTAPDSLPQRPPPQLGAPVIAPAQVAVPAHPNWSLGVGLSLVTSEERFFSMSYMSVSSGGLPRLGLSSGSQPAPAIQAITAPRISVLIERRVSQPLFLTFQASASYGEGKNEVSPELTAHQLELDGELGFRHVLNPRGLVEISWFATAGVRYANVESRSLVGVYNQSPPYDVTMTLRVSRGHSFAVGVVAGLAVERELIEGLALRLSAGILGASYGLSSFNDWTSAEAADYRVHEFDLGLRFIPSLALRYAF